MSVQVHLRLPDELWQRLSDEAQLARRALAEHIRETLAKQIDIVSELASLRAMLTQRGESGHDAELSTTLEALRDAAEDGEGMLPGDRAIALETLLLLREIAGPARARPVQGHVESVGLPVWSGGRL
jgi:predicted DNA-binding protein